MSKPGKMIKKVFINIQPQDKKSFPLLRELLLFLDSQEIEILLPDYDLLRISPWKKRIASLSKCKQADLVIVLGGDGTFIRTARFFAGKDKLIFGINRGKLGFLTEFSPQEYLKYLKKVIKGEYQAVDRFFLKVEHYRKNKKINEKYFFNDAVISKGSFSRLIKIELNLNNEFLNSFSGDGLIISTATGSTAYSLSAGGPIIAPNTENIFLLNPICPHSLAMRPMIIPGTSILKAKIFSEAKNLLLTIDGQEGLKIKEEDEIFISSTDKKIKLITHPQKNFYTILKEKLDWK